MKPKRGYYCLIQFCPDPSRAEAVNLGTLLFCPEAQFIAARMSRGNRRAAKLVGREGIDRASLNAAKQAMERRLDIDRDAFQTIEDLQRFVDTRANVLQLTAPRPMKVFNPEEELNRLFDRLVGGQPSRPERRVRLPELDELFHRLKQENRARLKWSVRVPVLDRDLRVPYAYRNGTWNLVCPRRFPSEEGDAIHLAQQLAVDGDLLYRHTEQEEGRKQLVVVPHFGQVPGVRDLQSRIVRLFNEYEVKTVSESEVQQFVFEVEREAHCCDNRRVE
jgi:hypothetical protein